MSEPIKPLEFHPQPDGRVHFLLPSSERVGFKMYLQERLGVRVDLVRQKMMAGFDELFFRVPPGANSKETCERVQEAYGQWRGGRKSQ